MSESPFHRAGPHGPAAALCLGLAAATAVRASPPAIALIAAGLGAAALADRRGRYVALVGAIALLGWWWGSGRLDALDRSVLLGDVGDGGRFLVAVTGPARRSPFGIRVPAQVRRFGNDSLREPVLLKLPPVGRSPPQGALLEVIGAIRLPSGPKHGFDERAWLRRRGVHVVIRGGRWRVVGHRGGLAGVSDRVRERLAGSLARGLHGERRGVLEGIVLGEDEGLSDELRGRFRASGLYHLLAVSGQNVALVAGGALLLAWLVGVPRWLGEIGALSAIVAYVLAVGWQPSVVRAGVAGALASLAWLAARPRDRWYFLLFGAGVLLAWNPYSLLDPGFQLSFAAVAAIFLAVPRLERRLEGYPLPASLSAVIAVSAACGLATAPILLLQFGSIPLYTVPANALAAPVVAPLLGLGLVTALVAPVAPGLAEALAWLNGWLAAYLAACARMVGALPYASVSSRVAVLVLAVALGVWLAAPRLGRRRGPFVLAFAALALVVTVGWRLRPADELPPPRGLRISFLDVGQGDGILLQVPQGAVLVDEGVPEAHVARQLRRLGVRRLAVLVLTHPQRDHVGGAAEVLEKLRVGFVLDPQLPGHSVDEKRALEAARRRHVRLVVARAGDGYRLGKLRLRVLWPDGPGSPGDDPNMHAIVLLASYGDIDALLTADAESDVTGRLRLPPVEILKVAHHGSADPGLPELLERLRPRLAVISVGEHNDYGHPAPSTAATLARFPGLDVHRTDRDGRVVVESDGERISVRDER